MSSTLSLINVALFKAGIAQEVVDIGEATREARTAVMFFQSTVDEVLRSYPWNFATKSAAAADAEDDEAMALYDGTESDPANKNYTYAYRYPTDCLRALRIVPATGRRFTATPIPFMVARNSPQTDDDPDADLVLVFTSEVDAVLEYTARVNLEITSYVEPLFEDCLTTLLASKFAMTIARDNKLSLALYQLYEAKLPRATAINANEQQQEPDTDQASWHAAR